MLRRGVGGENVLIRRHLRERLADYYSQPSDSVVGSISPAAPNHGGIDFASLLGEWHWRRTHARAHEEQRGMWLTPVELFYPHYSNVLGEFVRETTAGAPGARSDAGYEIVELGGGRGTNARAVLDRLRDRHPDAYGRLRRYAIYDASPTLHELQRGVLVDGSSPHADKVELVNVDMTDVAEGTCDFLPPSDRPTAVIAAELLDNLPHDKVGRCVETGKILQGEVASNLEGHSRNYPEGPRAHGEVFSPLTDPLLKRVLSTAPDVYVPAAARGPGWVPTVALGILARLFESRANLSIAFADFDWLPPPDLGWMASGRGRAPVAEPAIGDPIVTDMRGNDHPCYLAPPSDALCDILFPTDFGRLVSFSERLACDRSSAFRAEGVGTPKPAMLASAMKQSEFLLRYGPEEVRKTKGWSGYSPLVEDFRNCSVLVVTTQ